MDRNFEFRRSAMLKMRVLSGLATAVVIAASMMAGTPAQGASAPVGNPAPSKRIDARLCDTNQVPKQIRLVLAPGAVICYGGTVGTLDLGELFVQSLVAGGYTGWLRCEDPDGSGFQQFFDPGDIEPINDTCQTLAITPPN
jgi:hypothetical protein